MKHVLTILMGIVLLLPVSAQTNTSQIRGKVIDISNSDPIYSAYIHLSKSGIKVETVLSDIDGNYYFKELDTGDYEIVATAIILGYDSLKLSGIQLKSGQTQIVDIKMDKKGSGSTKTCVVIVRSYKAPLLKADGNSRTYSSASLTKMSNKSYSNKRKKKKVAGAISFRGSRTDATAYYVDGVRVIGEYSRYDKIEENKFNNTNSSSISTFSIDVDVASYSNVRGSINRHQKPVRDAVRIEELINYFKYDLPNPTGQTPFSVTTQLGTCPWNKKHHLVQIAMKGKDIMKDSLPPNNLVFLIDVSGSMQGADRLILLKKGMKLLVNELREEDNISIVVYAGAAGVVLPKTNGMNKEKILSAIDDLEAGGSTAGGAGIKLAYKIAQRNFLKKGKNRIILATDGDFNIGVSGDGALVKLIEEKRESGVYLSVLGFGYGNFQSSKMEKLADKGNGNFAFIDNILEAKKVLVTEMGGTLLAIAKDVKIQVEFNPNHVSNYRLIGYENRMLENKDFKDDKKDAGELGSGHTIVALYEIIPNGVEIDDSMQLRYKKTKAKQTDTEFDEELMFVKLRYKLPNKSKSILLSTPVLLDSMNKVNQDFYHAAAVAQFGMLLRSSKYCKGTYGEVINLANKGLVYDPGNYRKSFISMVETVQLMGW
jgi:Ca-activated chloride channel family protein